MKNLICCLGLTMISVCTQAQDVTKTLFLGAKAGLSISNINGIDSDKPDSRIGMHAGAVLVSGFTWKHALQLELVYSNKGFGSSGPNVESDYRLNYLDIPLLYRYNLAAKRKALFKSKGYAKSAFLLAGPQFSTLLGGTHNLSITTGTGEGRKTTESETNLKSYINPFEFSVIAGIGYNVTSNLLVNARYGLGLSGIGTTSNRVPEKAKNTTIQVGLAYLFPVN